MRSKASCVIVDGYAIGELCCVALVLAFSCIVLAFITAVKQFCRALQCQLVIYLSCVVYFANVLTFFFSPSSLDHRPHSLRALPRLVCGYGRRSIMGELCCVAVICLSHEVMSRRSILP